MAMPTEVICTTASVLFTENLSMFPLHDFILTVENGKTKEHWGEAKKLQTFGWTQLLAVMHHGELSVERGILWAAELAAGTSFPAQEKQA